jgi:hypothetical protein
MGAQERHGKAVLIEVRKHLWSAADNVTAEDIVHFDAPTGVILGNGRRSWPNLRASLTAPESFFPGR